MIRSLQALEVLIYSLRLIVGTSCDLRPPAGYRTAECVVQYRTKVRYGQSLTVSYKNYKIGTVLLIIISSRLPARYDL